MADISSYSHYTDTLCGRYGVADIDVWPTSTLLVADMVFCVADMVVGDIVCGRYRRFPTICIGVAIGGEGGGLEGLAPFPSMWAADALFLCGS